MTLQNILGKVHSAIKGEGTSCERDIDPQADLAKLYTNNMWLGMAGKELGRLVGASNQTEYSFRLEAAKVDLDAAKDQVTLHLDNLMDYMAKVDQLLRPSEEGIITQYGVRNDQDQEIAERATNLVSYLHNLKQTMAGKGERNIPYTQLAQEVAYVSQEVAILSQGLAEDYVPIFQRELANEWNGFMDLTGDALTQSYQAASPGAFVGQYNSNKISTLKISDGGIVPGEHAVDILPDKVETAQDMNQYFSLAV